VPSLEHLRRGQAVRVRTQDGRQVEGQIVGLVQVPPSIELSDHLVSSIALASADSLWTRGSTAGSGALIGGGILGATSALVAYSICTQGSGEPVCTGAVVLGAAAVGAVVGAGLGAAIGSYIVRWHLFFARSPSQVRLGLRAAL